MIKTRLVKLLPSAKKYIVFQVVWQWLALVCQVIMIYSVSMVLGYILHGAVTPERLWECAFWAAAALAVRFACDRRAVAASYRASADVKRVLREKIYQKLLRLGASYREQVPTSEVVQMSGEGVEQLETYFGRYLPQLFYSMLAPLTLFVFLSFINWRASLVLLACVPLIPASIVAVQKFAKKLLDKYWGIYMGLGDSFLENLQELTTLKIYQTDEKKAKEMDEESQQFRRITMKVLTMQLNSTSVMDIMAYGGAAVGMIVTLRELALGRVGASGALMIILLASEFFIPLRLLGSFFHIAMNSMAASDRIFALLDLSEPKKKEGQISPGPVDISMRDVHFSYAPQANESAEPAGQVSEGAGLAGRVSEGAGPARQMPDGAGSGGQRKEGRSQEVLRGIDMEFPAGSFTSLVGTSGCGKSTVAGILMGRNRGYQGSILIGGQEASKLAEESLMEHITMVTHNSYLFKGTVEENLRLGKPEATREEMEAALDQVNLLGFLKEQQGLDTFLQERGGNFSGGQRQRLAIARALLHDSEVYIFDEATSNIDMESEELIMQAIHQLAKTKTVVLISHRLANVVSSDRIYMMKDGRAVQCGTHRELMEAGGDYRELYQYQKELEQFSCQNSGFKTGRKAVGNERNGKENGQADRSPDYGTAHRTGKAPSSRYACGHYLRGSGLSLRDFSHGTCRIWADSRAFGYGGHRLCPRKRQAVCLSGSAGHIARRFSLWGAVLQSFYRV